MVSVAEQEFLYKELTYAIMGAVPAAGENWLSLQQAVDERVEPQGRLR